jgi:hypothetical protein
MRNAEIINTEMIGDIAELIKMSFKYGVKPLTKENIQEKIKQFNDWNNENKFYEFALNLTEEEQKMIFDQVCAWSGI